MLEYYDKAIRIFVLSVLSIEKGQSNDTWQFNASLYKSKWEITRPCVMFIMGAIQTILL